MADGPALCQKSALATRRRKRRPSRSSRHISSFDVAHASGIATAVPVTLRADLLPLSINIVTPDQGGTGDDEHRWVTVDIYGSRFKAGALVKLSRPGEIKRGQARINFTKSLKGN